MRWFVHRWHQLKDLYEHYHFASVLADLFGFKKLLMAFAGTAALTSVWTWIGSLTGPQITIFVLLCFCLLLAAINILQAVADLRKRNESPFASHSFEGKISLKCEMVQLPKVCPPEGYIYTLSLHCSVEENAPLMHTIGFGRRIETPGQIWEWGDGGVGLKCEVKNYDTSTVKAICVDLEIEFRKIEMMEGGWREGDIRAKYTHPISIDVLRGNAADTFIFYITNLSSFSAAVHRPIRCSFLRLEDDESARKDVALMQDLQSMWMPLSPYKTPKLATE